MSRRVISKKDCFLLKLTQKNLSTAVADGAAASPALSPNLANEDDYISRITKYIPAEIVTGFIAVDGILKAVTDASVFLYWFIFAFCLVLTPLYTWRISNENGLPVAKSQIVISTCSFVCWVLAFGGPFAYYDWYRPYIGSVLLVLATLLFPMLTNMNNGKNP